MADDLPEDSEPNDERERAPDRYKNSIAWERAVLTQEDAQVMALVLFEAIERVHGHGFARKIFNWLGGATKADSKAFFDMRLRMYYEYLCSQLGEQMVSKRGFAEFLAAHSAERGWYYGFGRPGDITTADTIRNRLYEVLGQDE
jgi:hypothetical protein